MSKVKKLRVNKKLGIIILITVLLIVIVFRCAFLFKQSFSSNMVNAERLDSMNDCLNTYIISKNCWRSYGSDFMQAIAIPGVTANSNIIVNSDEYPEMTIQRFDNVVVLVTHDMIPSTNFTIKVNND